MLKIKDNVDLKELEKFGLKPRYKLIDNTTGKTTIEGYHSSRHCCRFGNAIFRRKDCNKFLNIINRLIGNKVERKTFIFEDDNFVDTDLLYDLIKAGYVEKVGE